MTTGTSEVCSAISSVPHVLSTQLLLNTGDVLVVVVW